MLTLPSIPNISDSDLDDAKERRRIMSYLYKLDEQLRYMLTHLGYENFAGDVQQAIQGSASMEMINEANGNLQRLSTVIEQTAGQIALKADQSEVDELGQDVSSLSSEISLVPGQITSAVTAIQVGGTNLAAAGVNGSGVTISSGYVAPIADTTLYYIHSGYLYRLEPPTSTYNIINYPNDAISVYPGTYTLSFFLWKYGTDISDIHVRTNFYSSSPYRDHYFGNFTPSDSTPKRCAVTFTVDYTQQVNLRFVTDSHWTTGQVYVSDVMLERGNKASDYSPAPYDTDAAITATRSMITQTASEIRAEVSDISIGGTNLLPGTRDWSGAVISRATQDGTYQDCDVMHYNFTASGSPSYSDSIRFNGLDFDSGGTYMISFWCKGSGSFTLQTATAYMVGTRTSSQGITGGGNFGEIRIDVPTDWTRIWVKWQINSGTWTDKSILFRQITNASNLYVAGVKLERGDKATDWSESEDELINSSVTINDSGIYMSTKGTLQIDADDPAKKGRIALGELMSLDYTGGLQAKDGSFANSLKVNGKQVMTVAEITAPIKVATSQPSGHGFLWVKPTSVTSASYSAYSAGSRDSTVHFGATNPISRSFTADTTATLANATFTYTLDFDVYCLTDLAQVTNVTFTAKATKGSASVSFGASAAMTMTKYTLAHVTLTASSSTNLCTNANAISVAITASASSLTKLFIQSDQYMTLKISNQAGTGTQTCSVYYVN